MAVIRILLVHEIRLMCSVVAAVLADEPDIEVIGHATTFDEALVRAPQSDVVLISTRLPDQGALKLTESIARDYPETRVLVLGLAEAEEEILRYVEAGASGYVLKDDSVDELLRNIRAVHSGEAVVSPEIAAALISRLSELSQLFADAFAIDQSADLTPREREVLGLLGEGLTNQEIADRLVIELGTVKNHVHNILDKLNVSSRRDAAAYLAIMEDGATTE